MTVSTSSVRHALSRPIRGNYHRIAIARPNESSIIQSLPGIFANWMVPAVAFPGETNIYPQSFFFLSRPNPQRAHAPRNFQPCNLYNRFAGFQLFALGFGLGLDFPVQFLPFGIKGFFVRTGRSTTSVIPRRLASRTNSSVGFSLKITTNPRIYLAAGSKKFISFLRSEYVAPPSWPTF